MYLQVFYLKTKQLFWSEYTLIPVAESWSRPVEENPPDYHRLEKKSVWKIKKKSTPDKYLNKYMLKRKLEINKYFSIYFNMYLIMYLFST